MTNTEQQPHHETTPTPRQPFRPVMPWARRALVGALLSLFVLAVHATTEDAYLPPSSHYGTITVGAEPAPVGAAIRAEIGGVIVASDLVFDGPEGPSYRLHLPGDDPTTPAREGGAEGDPVVLFLNGVALAEGGQPTTTWHLGQFERLDLDAPSGPGDLALGLAADVAGLAPGGESVLTFTVDNLGFESIAEIALTATLPEHTTLVTASDGATLDGATRTVTWPAFDLDGGARAPRTVTLLLVEAPPADLDEIAIAGQVAQATGPDPNPSNDTTSLALPVLRSADLRAISVDRTHVVDDAQTFEVSGSARVTFDNQGLAAAPAGIDVTVFEDRDFDGLLDPAVDTVLGVHTTSSPLAAPDTLAVDVTLSGTLTLRGNRLHAWVDSGDLITEVDELDNFAVSGCTADDGSGTQIEAPDLTLGGITLDLDGYPAIAVALRVGNAGAVVAEAGAVVELYDGDPASGGVFLASTTLDAALDPGAFVDLTLGFESSGLGPATIHAVVTGTAPECDSTNDAHSLDYDTTDVGLFIALDDGRDTVRVGDTLDFVVRATNADLLDRTGVELRLILDEHALFVAADGGGTLEVGPTFDVVWPVVDLPAGTTIERTVTLQVADAVPSGIDTWSQRATVGDDGTQGPDPTPGNNTALDVDRIVTLEAVAGGPYTGDEGLAIVLDGSASSSATGPIVQFLWDLDDDGEFDDAGGPTPTIFIDRNGTFPITLQVTDSEGQQAIDATTLTVLNVAPVVEAPESGSATESAVVSLGVPFVDPGLEDTHVATIDWGDGSPVEPLVIDATGRFAEGQHPYLDDGLYTLEACVTDDDGATGCDTIALTVENSPPELALDTSIDFGLWRAEHYGSAGNWTIQATAQTVTQTRNSAPTVFYSDFPAVGRRLSGTLEVNTASDDDFVGFVLGFEPGDSHDPEADFLLVDWKQGTQSFNFGCGSNSIARRGLAISRVRGAVIGDELWGHRDGPCTEPDAFVEELARANTLGSVGWRDRQTYELEFETTDDRVRVFVEGVLEIDLDLTTLGGPDGSDPFRLDSGRFGFYNYSQQATIYGGFDSLGLSGPEGAGVLFGVDFTDLGPLDTHTATVDWGDGTIEPATVVPFEGGGTVGGEHLYPDDGHFEIEVCVRDDDGGTDCAFVPVAIVDQPAQVDAGGDSLAYVGEGLDVLATFVDPGVLDTHIATIDWGDAEGEDSVEPATLEAGEDCGVASCGTVTDSHHYAAEGDYTVTVCVDPADGGNAFGSLENGGCDAFTVRWRVPTLDLAVDKAADRTLVRPGEVIVYTLTVENEGTREPEDVELVDVLPPYLDFVSATDGGQLDTTTQTVSWSFDRLALGETVAVNLTLRGTIDQPFDTPVTNRATVTDDGRFGPDLDPSDNLAEASVVLWDAGTPRLEPGDLATTVEEGEDLDLLLGFDDPDGAGGHVATLDWGDGTVEPATITPGGGGGTLAGSHRYGDDGVYILQACVTDDGGATGCLDFEVTVTNVEPVVSDPGTIDLRTWRVEEYPIGASQGSADWQVDAEGTTVHQRRNSRPSVFFGDFLAFGTRIQGKIRVDTTFDDDFVGFVLGYQPGDHTNPDADFLLVDWKELDQDCARDGLAVSRITGTPSSRFCTGEFWAHQTTDAFEELARAATLGSTGWRPGRDYEFTFELDAERFRLLVDDVVEIDLEGSFENGRLGFFNHSQQNVIYSAFTRSAGLFDEGEIAQLETNFVDPGFLDTHTATLDWRDGTVTDGTVIEQAGLRQVLGEHLYLDDADYPVEVCVTDDDGALGCGTVVIAVRNVAPVLDVGPDRSIAPGRLLTLSPGFTDVGTLDTHTATVDWGDGSPVEAVPVIQGAGEGTVDAAHTYLAEGDYTVEVCVTDDDGGTACDSLTVRVAALGTTTECVPEPFDCPEWTLALLGDADQGEATVTADRLLLAGNGSSLYHDGDHAAFYHRTLPGGDDFRIEVDVAGFPVDQGGAVRKTALMLRSGLGTYDPRVMVTYVPHMPADPASDPATTALQFDFRALPGDGGTEMGNTVFEVPLPTRLAIEKRGDRYTVLYSVASTDDGEPTWVRPVDATYQGSVVLDLGPTIHAGVAVSSYDSDVTLTAELADAALCRPEGSPAFDPPDPAPCDPDRALDLVVFLDLSGSMTAPYPTDGGEITRLEAAQQALGVLTDRLLAGADGSRMALVTMAGHRTPEENLAGAFTVHRGLTEDLAAIDTLVQGFDPTAIDTGTTTPAALALRGVTDLLTSEHDPARLPVVLWVTDGVPNIDSAGRGPDAYELEALQAIALRAPEGGFLPWGEVAWLGEFNGELGTFDGEPLANAMFELERLVTTVPETVVYGLALQGDGVDLGTFNQDLVDYAAFVGGGRSFSASDGSALLAAIDVLGTDLDCGGVGSATLAGRVWHDVDRNGLADAGEPDLAGVRVDLFDGAGFGITTTTTDATGGYVFGQLPAGTFVVRVDATTLPEALVVPTFDADGIDTVDLVVATLVDGEQRLDLDFGYAEVDTGPPAVVCAVDGFDGLDPMWQLAELGDADQGAAAVVDGRLHLTGDGTSLFHGDDNAAFFHQELTGDFRVELGVEDFPLDQGGPVRKGCLMVRGDLGPRAPRVMVCFIPHLPDPPTTALQFDVRHLDGSAEELATIVLHVPLPVDLAIVRQGDVFHVEHSRDGGATWTRATGQLGGSVVLPLAGPVLVGAAVASYDPVVVTTAAFDDFRVCVPNPDLP